MPIAYSPAHAPLIPSWFCAALVALCACTHAETRSESSASPAHAAAAPRTQPAPQIEAASLAQLQAAMASGALTSRALTQHYLERIARYDKAGPKLNAFLLVNPRALEEADSLDRERAAKGARGPL